MVTVGVLALQGGFSEHLSSLRKAANYLTESQSPLPPTTHTSFRFIEVRTPEQLASCDALVIPGGESTTLSLVAAQSGLIEPLREFVKVSKKPTWGTCAGLILLCEEASATKRGGQELIGGLDVKVHRNHFGRQIESFVTDLELPFLSLSSSDGEANGTKAAAPFPAVFIRAPVVDQLLTNNTKLTDGESNGANPSEAVLESNPRATREKVEVLAILEGRHASNKKAAMGVAPPGSLEGAGDIVALRQGNVFGMSFHPELTDDIRIHVWWLHQVTKALA